MLDRYPLTCDDVGPTAKVGGEPPGRVWGSGVPLGTLWMVLRGWSRRRWPVQFLLSAGFVVLLRLGRFSVMCAEWARSVDKKKWPSLSRVATSIGSSHPCTSRQASQEIRAFRRRALGQMQFKFDGMGRINF